MFQQKASDFSSTLCPKGKSLDYYNKTQQFLGYTFFDNKVSVYYRDTLPSIHHLDNLHNYQNMIMMLASKSFSRIYLATSSSIIISDGEQDFIHKPLSWAQRMDAQWELHFEQCESPTDD